MASKCRAALILGTFTKASEPIQSYFTLTETAKIFDMNFKGNLTAHLLADGPFQEGKKVKLFHFEDPTTHRYVRKYDRIAVVDLGPLSIPKSLVDTIIKSENIIDGIVFAIKLLSTKHFDELHIESCGEPKIVGTTVALILPSANAEKYNNDISFKFFDDFHLGGELEYKKGIFLGKGQKLAQQLMKSSSVKEFVKMAKLFIGEFRVRIIERNDLWMKKQGMNALLSVAKNSGERPVILELIYNASKKTRPLVLVGKATPYENSLFPLRDKPEFRQFLHRSGMGGASSIIGSLYTLCKLGAPVRVHCIIAVVWNHLHDKANKKGDVLKAMNGTSIQIDTPKAEGRLIMADVLCYADTLDPSAIVDVTTLSSNIDSIIGNSYIGFFTTDKNLKTMLVKAAISSGEKVWQLPLYKCFRNLLKIPNSGIISNVGTDAKSATTCKSASFLQEFVKETTPWIHLDISAVTDTKGKLSYLNDWATGRSTRLIVEFCLEFFREK